jgi:hypothetical protein
MTYAETEKIRAVAWKQSTDALPDDAKRPAPYVTKQGTAEGRPYDFCLPPEHAALTLLPEVRDRALALFADLRIPWHAGVGTGPSNHLLSSQVQCVNALGQMVDDPMRIMKAFGDLLDIEEVLQIEPGRHLTFEYIGPTDFFNEAPGTLRVRGAHCTSVDAAFLHRAQDGAVELVLVEWKYTESYRLRRPDPRKDITRAARYAEAVADAAGPIRADVLEFPLLLDEPFYQLVRQQLLAHALETDQAEGASRVRVVHVLPPANLEYQKSLVRAEHRQLGATVGEVWGQLQRRPDRFVSMDSAVFWDSDITSLEYGLRYADDVIPDLGGLLAALDLEDADGLQDALDVEADLVVTPSGVELLAGRMGHVMDFPFRLTELYRLVDELEE